MRRPGGLTPMRHRRHLLNLQHHHYFLPRLGHHHRLLSQPGQHRHRPLPRHRRRLPRREHHPLQGSHWRLRKRSCRRQDHPRRSINPRSPSASRPAIPSSQLLRIRSRRSPTTATQALSSRGRRHQITRMIHPGTRATSALVWPSSRSSSGLKDMSLNRRSLRLLMTLLLP